MSREKTVEEVREEYLNTINGYVNYWSELEGKTIKERLSGLAFSMLVILDGGAIGLPGFIVAPYPHPDDKQYNINNNENYYPELNTEVKSDIAGCLHEVYSRKYK